jgi:HEAT repeat protein
MPSYVKTAYYGDLPSLKQEIGRAAASGRISQSDVVDLAEAVARRELRSARGDDALQRVLDARPCVAAVEPELRERAQAADDAGAEAMLVLAEAGKLNRAGLVGKYAQASRGSLRAVAARGTGSTEHATLRRRFYVDPDERVRREALRAAADAADPTDLDAVVEAARLDPDPMSRGLATRVVGRIGGERAVTALADLWAHADEQLQVAIVDAWAMPGVLPSGGRASLVRTAEESNSMASIDAAAALMRVGGDTARIGRAVLVRGIKEGTAVERVAAIQLAPLPDTDVVASLDDAAAADDLEVRVVALARLLDVPARRAATVPKLQAMAQGTDGAARQARLALAAASDPAAAALLEKDLFTGAPVYRERAAVALFRLGKASKMAPSLADPDPSVRMAVACSLVAEPGPT